MKNNILKASRRNFLAASFPIAAWLLVATPIPAIAATATEIDKNATEALSQLIVKEPSAKALASKAVAILVFPKIVKAGFLIGGQRGDGALRMDGKTVGYYNISALSAGMQAGVQSFGYALFFIDKKSLSYLEKSDGWAIGTGPSIVIVDEGFGKTLTSTTLTQDVYSMVFGQKGLMAGVGLEGSKITHIHPK